jgi:DUF4097 and DUF4098 domain-containing protein YvlB
MSSAPQPPPQYYYRRSFVGPVILIAIGVLFLLVNMHLIAWPSLGLWFAHYWPVILIAIGVLKLAEYYTAQQHGYRAPGLGAGTVLLIIFLCMFGFAATKGSHVNWNAVGNDMDWDNGGWTIWGETYNYNDQIEQPFPDGSNLQVVSDAGSVTVNAWDQKTIRVVVHKKVNSDSQGSADRVNGSTKPTISIADKLLIVNANTTGGGTGRVRSDLEIFLPASAAADISTRRGDIVIRSRAAEVKANTSHGDVTVEDVKGDATLTARGGSLEAKNIAGDVIVNSGRLDDTTISDVSGAVKLNGEFTGTTRLSKIAKGVQFTSSRTDLKFGKLDGEMTMDMGQLRANQLAGPFTVVTRSKDINLDDISGDIKVENTNGEVNVNPGKLPLGNIEIDNHRGQVALTLPAAAGFQADLRTRRGEINSDFPGISVNNNRGEATASGTFGKGGPKVTITNDAGGVYLKKVG